MKIENIIAELKKNEWIDLTHSFGELTPRWSGFNQLSKKIILDFDKYPVRTHLYTFPGQYGTHIDAPAHASESGRTLDKIDLKECVLPLCVIDCSQKVLENPDYALKVEDIDNYEINYGKIPEGSFVAMRSDWYKNWPDQEKFLNMDMNGESHYPGWDIKTVEFLIKERKILGIGHETFDTDPPQKKEQYPFKAEVCVLKNDIYQIELLANLDKVPARGSAIFCIFPKQEGGTGFPVRCFAIYSK